MPNGKEREFDIADWLWNTVSGFFSSMFENVWHGFTNIFPSAVEATWDTLKDRFTKKAPSFAVDLIDVSVSMGLLTQAQANTVKKLCQSIFPFDGLMGTLLFANLVLKYVRTLMEATGGKLTQDLNKAYSPFPPGAGNVIQAAFVAPEKAGEVRDAMKRTGLSDEDIDLMFLSAYRLYDEMTIRALFLRGVLSEDEMYVRMRELGYTDTRIKEIIQQWDIIPNPQDLLMMVAKEAFEPDEIERYGLAEEFPEEQSQWLTKQGLSRYWQEKYWAAHWEYPSYGQVLEMLHRGLITEEDVYEYYRVIEIPTYWRNLLTKINYMPYTRVDVRRMHQMGVLTDEELLRSYKDIGYDDEHAQKMSEFTLAYNAQTTKQLTQSQIMKGYVNKIITREDAHGLLSHLKLGDDYIEYILSMADFDEALDVQNDILTAIKTYYTSNLISKQEALDRLNQLNLTGERINSLLERWEPSRMKNVKIPSKTDLDKMLKAKIISEDQYRSEMERLGYGFLYTDWYLSLAKKGK